MKPLLIALASALLLTACGERDLLLSDGSGIEVHMTGNTATLKFAGKEPVAYRVSQSNVISDLFEHGWGFEAVDASAKPFKFSLDKDGGTYVCTGCAETPVNLSVVKAK